MSSVARVIILVLFVGSFVAFPIHFWLSDRLQVLHVLYPLSAALSAPTLNCSAEAPVWMSRAIRFSLWNNHAPAGQLAYIAPDGSIKECHYGWLRGPLQSGLVTKDTRFRYASMTKLLVADLVLRDARNDRLALESSLVSFLWDHPHVLKDERLNQITVGHLLRHSTGFDRLKSGDPMVIHAKRPWCPYQTAPLMDLQLDFTPGERYAYSNINYCLLGLLLERSSASADFRARLELEYQLTERGMRFIDGPYLDDEVAYDFRHSGFYGHSYWQFFDFFALSSSMGLSGSAQALAELLASLGNGKNHPLIQAPVESICDETVKRGCYGYALFRYRPAGETLLVHVQPGLLYGAPSLAIIDEHGGITVWVGNGTREGGGTTDAMLDHLYAALADHYAAEQR